MADTNDEPPKIPEKDRIEIIKAVSRLEAMLERLDDCPSIDMRARDLIEIAMSILTQQLEDNVPWKPLPIESLINDLLIPDFEPSEDDSPSPDDLEEWFRLD